MNRDEMVERIERLEAYVGMLVAHMTANGDRDVLRSWLRRVSSDASNEPMVKNAARGVLAEFLDGD